MPHIMHIIESLEFGGAEKVVVHLANKLSINNKVSICITKRKGELINELEKTISIYFLHSPEGNDLSLPSKIRKLLINESVDILHSHNWGVFLESALAVRKTQHVKLISTIHGPYTAYSPGIKSKIKIKLRHLSEKYLSRYFYKIITVSSSIQTYIKKDINIDQLKLLTIYNGLEDIGKNIKKQKNNKVRFITVGRLAKIKNHRLMLDAFKIIMENNYGFEFTIVGDGPEKNALMKYCSNLGLDKYVKFLGFKTDVKNILLAHDVFLLSSEYEGISIALLESMSLSMPAIATSVGGIPETIINNQSGYLVSFGDTNEYAEKIKIFLTKKENINIMGHCARKYFIKAFKEDVVLKKHQILYEKCQSNAT